MKAQATRLKTKLKLKKNPVKSRKRIRTGGEPRVRDIPKHRSFRVTKKKFKQHTPIPNGYTILKLSLSVVRANKKLFLGLALINAILSFAVVQGFQSPIDINGLKGELQSSFNGSISGLGSGVVLFGYLIQTAGSGATEGSGAYQIFLTVISSLATIWAVRQIRAGEKPGIKDVFYKGMYPLIPFILTLGVIALQLVPLLVGNVIYSTVLEGGLATTAAEKAVWLLLFGSLALLSAYMVLSSIFSLYIVTLPDMTPLKALRSARELVLHRRLTIVLRIMVLPIVLTFISAIIFIPLLIFITPLAQILFVVLTSFALMYIHVYMYLLYRSLI